MQKVWGGNRLVENYGKNGSGSIGESWEVSGVKDHISLVANGELAGLPLTHLITSYGPELLGHGVYESYGNKFPLLIKFIDAEQDLSVQLHPDDEVAGRRHNSFGKTEMWYILDAEEEARLILGFNQPVDKQAYKEHLSEGTITEILGETPVKSGDAFYIAPGTVHAIGAGIVLAEIQQTSDVTYRIYDWDRPGMDGQMRELHTEEALDVIDFSSSEAALEYETIDNSSSVVCNSPYFNTGVLKLSRAIQKQIKEIDSFIIYMCVEGEASVKAMGSSEKIKKGETLLIPACAEAIEFDTKNATLLEVSVPPRA